MSDKNSEDDDISRNAGLDDLDDLNFNPVVASQLHQKKLRDEREFRRRCTCLVVVGMIVAIIILTVILIVVLLRKTPRSSGILDSIVLTECGILEGEYDGESQGHSFKGIPYALPPIGNRRWHPPTPLNKTEGTCWEGTFKATKFGNQCPQFTWDASAIVGDEDCLYLDVYSPKPVETSFLPVIVYIHGGYLQLGNSSTQGYSPNAALAKKHNVVYVSIQYRLNALGFLVLDILPNRSGNYGILDQIQALKWVKNNIQNFGGDPGKVTLLGHSSGATSLYALASSPLAKGLFQRAWAMSGSPYIETPLSQAEQRNNFVKDLTKCSTEECLYNLDAYSLVATVSNLEKGWFIYPSSDLPIKGLLEAALLVIDGNVLPEKPFDMWEKKSGQYSEVPFVIGTTAQESDWGPLPGEAIHSWTWQDLWNYTKTHMDTFNLGFTDQLKTLYNTGGESDPAQAFTSMISDARVNCMTDILAERMADAISRPVYRYVVTAVPSNPVYALFLEPPCNFAFHGLDIFAYFDALDLFMKDNELQASDKAFNDVLTENILEFARTGKPKNADWRPFPGNTALVGETLSITPKYNEEQCDFWTQNGFFRYSWIN